MTYLEYFLYQRCAVLWVNRKLPSYLGPSVTQLLHLFILVAVNSMVLLALSILLGKTLWGLGSNVSTIEGWEIERHHSNLRRARTLGGYLTALDGSRIRVDHQEYPWDIGILSNICQGMGTWNPISWLSPFAYSPTVQSGLSFEHNGIEDPSKPWPPPDPDRMFRSYKRQAGDAFTQPMDIESFKERQAADMQRYVHGEHLVRRKPFADRYRQPIIAPKAEDDYAVTDGDDDEDEPGYGSDEGEEAWATKEGERLADFGVDEDIEFYDEDDVPLAELIRRRQELR
ncbi:hypothetical protein AMS68_000790 [Peltaster fructicola]|uniref:Palmitoyltransferase n=1 Tax=Peltaster fructicola TaxID=286661 RepID=A0A6H0XKM4_9PEZI|nr:hypothetical protein AMS68_000790 [Peltaster fructicola]